LVHLIGTVGELEINSQHFTNSKTEEQFKQEMAKEQAQKKADRDIDQAF
jgi:hypothetical protein